MTNKFNPSKMKHLRKINKLLSLFIRTHKYDNPIDWSALKEIAILDPTAIGDSIMLIPFLKIIRKNAPNASITLVCGRWAKDILEDQGLVDRFILLNNVKALMSVKLFFKNVKEILATLREINRFKYDIALEPRGDLRYIFFMHFITSDRKASYNYTGGENMLTDVITPSNDVNHLINDKIYLLEQLGCDTEGEMNSPRLLLTEEQKSANMRFMVENRLEERYIIGIHPGASMKARQWNKFDELILLLGKKHKNCALIIFEAPNEYDTVAPLVNKAKSCNIWFAIIKESLKRYVGLMDICDHVICNDSSAGHIAAALGIPVTVIYGPAVPESVRPLGVNTINNISHHVECKPCISNTCLRGTYECLNLVTAEEVLEKI